MAYRRIEFSRIDAPDAVTPGAAPQLAWIDIDKLVVDEDYQRELKAQGWRAIRKIASGFRWSMFSPVFVAPVEGGLYAIIDGQHRTHAAAICGFAQVPCQIVQMTRTEQAAAFAAVNGTVTQVSAGQVLKAAALAGEPWALRLIKVAEDGGCRLMFSNGGKDKKAGQIYGAVSFRKLVDRHGDRVSTALRILTSVECWRDDGLYWDSQILLPTLGGLCQRPAAMANPAFPVAFAEWPVWQAVEDAAAQRQRRLREGQPPLAARELLESSLVDWIDSRFPARVGLPAPERLSRAEAMARIGALGA